MGIGTFSIGANSYMLGYEMRKSNTATEGEFLDIISEKAAQKEVDFDEKAFESMAPNAPEEVKRAWMEASKEAGVNGMGMMQDGKLSHISAMYVNRVEKWWNSGGNNPEDIDLLGNTVGSALRAAKEALYDLEHPLQPISQRSMAVQQQIIKEKQFYQIFIEKLEQAGEKKGQ